MEGSHGHPGSRCISDSPVEAPRLSASWSMAGSSSTRLASVATIGRRSSNSDRSDVFGNHKGGLSWTPWVMGVAIAFAPTRWSA